MTDKLKILCLHGYRQNGDVFKQKIGSFRKLLKSLADFTFIDAPHLLNPSNDEERCWWFNQSDGSFNIENGPETTGFDESLKLLEDTWKNGNFDGILAFSQAASFLSAVCGMKMKSLTTIDPKFVIFVCGFRSVSSEHLSLYNDLIDIQSLHISGKTDQVIPHEMHLKLEEAFVNPVTYHHDGGHHLPATSSDKIVYRSFLENQLKRLRGK